MCHHCQCEHGSHESACHEHEGCGHHSCGSEKKECDWAHQFLELADEAWMEVLKEKIKEHIRSDAKHLDELAKIISEANNEKWRGKMEKKQRCSCYEEKLRNFFSCSSKCKG